MSKHADNQAKKNKEKEEQRIRRQSLPAKFVYDRVNEIKQELQELNNVLTPAEEYALMRELDLVQTPPAPKLESIQSELFPIQLSFEEKGSVALEQLQERLKTIQKKRLSESAKKKLKLTVKKILILKKMLQLKQHREEQMIANETDRKANMPKPKKEEKKEKKERELKEEPVTFAKSNATRKKQEEEPEDDEPEEKTLPAMIDSLGLDNDKEKKIAKKRILARIATFSETERVLLANLFDKIEQYKRPVKDGGYGASTFDLDSNNSRHMSRNIETFLKKFNALPLKAKLQTLSNEIHAIKGGSVANKIGINKLLKSLASVISEMHPEAIYTIEGDVKMKKRGKAGRPKKKDKKSKKPSDE